MYIDGVNFHIRQGHSIDVIPMLVVIGVITSNQKTFLAIQTGDKESATTWRDVFKDLKNRGVPCPPSLKPSEKLIVYLRNLTVGYLSSKDLWCFN